MTKDDFYEREHGEGLTAAEFRTIQTEWLGMNNTELGAALGYASAETGRKRVLDFRNGRSAIPPTIATCLWYLLFTNEHPTWAER